MAENVSDLVRFYRGEAPDSEGRMITDIWAWDHRRLEMVHNYIQWLFPNPAPSRFNPDAPLLTGADIVLFRQDADLHARLLRSLDMMIDFYGLEWNADRTRIQRGSAFSARKDGWLTPTNHNYLRITRIFICLHLVGLDGQAAALFACLDDIAARDSRGAITDRTRAFWKSALEGSAL